MAEAPTTVAAPASGQLFSGIKFWVGHQVPQRSWLIQNMRLNGAELVVLENRADMCLVDHARKGHLPVGDGYYSYSFAEDSIRKGILEDPETHRVGIKSRAQRPVGSVTIAGKRTKTAFTDEDDQILYNWVAPFARSGGKWKGNLIYKQIEEKHPHHTYQSWRSRFIETVQYQHRTISENMALDVEHQGQGELDMQRSPKRRRLDGPATSGASHVKVPKSASMQSTSALVPDSGKHVGILQPLDFEEEPHVETEQHRTQIAKAEQAQSLPPTPLTSELEAEPDEGYDTEDTGRRRLRQSLVLDRALKQSVLALGFTSEQARSMYLAVPDVCNTKPEELDGCWVRLAEDLGYGPSHTHDEWRDFYHTLILPTYMRRNALASHEALEEFVETALIRERKLRKLKIKKEPVSSVRSSGVNQRTTKPARARVDSVMTEPSESDGAENDAADDGREVIHIPPMLRRPSPVLELSLHKMQRGAIQANEGRKRDSQQSTTTKSVSQPSDKPRPSQLALKKKLFGRTLDSQTIATQCSQFTNTLATLPPAEQSVKSASSSESLIRRRERSILEDVAVARVAIESQVRQDDNQVEYTNVTAPAESSSAGKMNQAGLETQIPVTPRDLQVQAEASIFQCGDVTIQSNPTKAIRKPTVQLPASEEPPESGQRFPQSSSISHLTLQSSSHHASEIQEQRTDTELKGNPVSQEHQPEVVPSLPSLVRHTSDHIDLLDEGLDGELDLHSEHALSDTGSEYMAFDTAPERSQLWDVPDDNDVQAEDKELDERPVLTGDSQQRVARKRSPTPLRRQSPSEGDEEESAQLFYRTKDSASPQAQIKHATNPLETQALFQMSMSRNSSPFDVPAPEGGWEDLGIQDIDDEQLDTILETTELYTGPDESIDERIERLKRRVSPVLSMRTASLLPKHLQGHASYENDSTIRRQPVVMLSASPSDTDSTGATTDEEAQHHRVRPRSRTHAQQLDSTTTDTDSATPSDSDSDTETSSVPDTTPQNSDIQAWFRLQFRSEWCRR